MLKHFKMLKIKWIVSLIAIVNLTGCATWNPFPETMKRYDKEVCGDLGVDGAHCKRTLLHTSRDLTKEEWDKQRFGWMCTHPDSFSDTESLIDQFCNTYKCDNRTKKILTDTTQEARLKYIEDTYKLSKGSGDIE